MAALEVAGLSVRYGPAVALDRLDLTIESGELFVLLGGSGSGKTTLLRALGGFIQPAAGRIVLAGQDITRLPPHRRPVNTTFQSYALFPHMNVADNVGFGLRRQGMPRADIALRVASLLELVRLGEFAKRKPDALSGGQRQRVALGRAIVREPQVFLMDEPLSNLDAKLRVQTRSELIKLHRRLGITTVYVTHDQVEAMTMGDRIAVMKEGVLQQLSTPQDLYDHPANIFVAGFIGSPAMNFVAGTLQSESGRLMLTHDNYSVPLPIDGLSNDIKENLGTRIGKPVVIGVRPEDVLDRAHANGMSGMEGLPATVDVVEPLGSEVLLYLDYGTETPMIIRAEPRTKVKPGDKMEVLFKPDNLHVFDGESELSIL